MSRKKVEARELMPEKLLEYFRDAGRRGGKKRASKMTKQELSEMGKRMVAAREAKRKQR